MRRAWRRLQGNLSLSPHSTMATKAMMRGNKSTTRDIDHRRVASPAACLAFVYIRRHDACAMTNWSLRRIFALMLAVFVTVGLNASVVQASDMALKMSASSGMSVNSHGDCHTCDGGNSDKSKPMVCTVACVAPVLIAVPEVGQAIFPVAAKLVPDKADLLVGGISPPDPFPPRSIDLV